ncbi:hypothetical protein [Occultella gossypii]|uniref:MinD-like ATPase involved in chromosome partitioning or flagellar assembly n=1 Tax=Occultella gossypii TaxID=2800820 RepID=A0ABS7S9T0_9MICO|nr:hypothetical protein [Occultella gossypii]MBZ2197102.1 hypothetical protein [Occultella gossypii]
MNFDNVPPHPRVSATIDPDGAAEVIFDGVPHYLRSGSLPGARRDVTTYVAQRARDVLGRAVLVHVSEPEGRFELAVHPDGSVDERASHDQAPEPSDPESDVTVMTRVRPPARPESQESAPEPAGAVEPAQPQARAEPAGAVEPAQPQAQAPRSPASHAPAAAPDHWAPPPRPAEPEHERPPAPQAPPPTRQPAAVQQPTPVTQPQQPAPVTQPAQRSQQAQSQQQAPTPHRAQPGSYPAQAAHQVPFPAPQQPPSSMPSFSPSAPQPGGPAYPHQSGGSASVPQPGGPAYPPQPGGPAYLPQPGEPALTRRQLRESFLTQEQVEAPASTGLRGVLARAGIKTSPSAAERSERSDRNTVSQHWPGVRTIAVVNGKGGANKTPTTALLAAVFARNSGAATLAWDNNVTRGTLGWRTDQGPHEATVLDLLPEVDNLLSPGAKAGDISHYVHHQPADKYDVLRSNPNLLSSETRISAPDVDAIHDVAGRYYRLVFVDSGNDESAENWLRMIDKADQLVVASIAKPEHAEAGALLLEELVARGGRSAELARGAVVVVSQAREKDTKPAASDIAQGFTGWVRETVTIPYDRAMVESVLRFDALAPATQRAWLRAGAAVAAGL